MGKGFQFKQFYISQDRCAMKVSETACVFGAFIPLTGREKSILDVGTGTGVLALMMAQRSKAVITAIDIDNDAIEEARHNITTSTFTHRIVVEKVDFLERNTEPKFDLIISNPPFFENQLPSINAQKRMAWHSSHLPLNALLNKAAQCLLPNGRMALLLPEQRIEETISMARKWGLFPYFSFTIQHNEHQKVKFSLLGLTLEAAIPLHERRIILRHSTNQYSETVFKQLKPFYASL